MFWLGVGAIALCIAALPLIRLVCKRISFVLRLQNVCREKKYTFTPLHPLWFLPLRGGDTFDFAVETRDDAYAVKFSACGGGRMCCASDQRLPIVCTIVSRFSPHLASALP